jgi:hypothetical protein
MDIQIQENLIACYYRRRSQPIQKVTKIIRVRGPFQELSSLCRNYIKWGGNSYSFEIFSIKILPC